MSKWKMVKLGDVCNPVKNIDNSFFVKNEYFEYLDIASIDKESKCIVNSVTTAIVEAPSRAKQPVVTGDLLVSTVRPNLNAVAFIEDKYDGCIASTGFCVLRPNVNNVHSRYIFYFIRTKKFVEYLINLATGASYPAVSDKIIKSCPIPLPPLPEQQRIVNLLDRAQELIDKRKKQLELMDSLVQSVFYEMFGDPVRNEMGWEVKSISDICEEIVDCVNKTAPQSEEITPYVMIRTSNIRYGRINFSNIKYVSQSTHSIWTRRSVPRNGDILFTREAPMGEVAIVDTDKKIFLGQRIMQYRCKHSECNPAYLLHLMQTSFFSKHIEKLGKGSTVKHLAVPDCFKFQIPQPSIDLQNKFAFKIKKIESLKQTMTASLRELEHNFNALSQREFGVAS